MSVYGVNNNNNRIQGSNPGASKGNVIDAVYDDESSKQVSVDHFLQLMITQLKNQDFMNPMDDTQYVTQLAQFATMQQMQDLAYYSTSNYTMSLVGKDVTVAKMTVGGNVEKIVGPVEKVALIDKEFKIFVKGQAYSLNQIMEVHNGIASGDKKLDASKYDVVPTTKTDTEINITWPVPTNDELLAGGLKYSVYYSTSPDFNSVADVKNGTLVGEADRSDLFKEKITGLNPDTTYFINVLVKDSAGNESVYSKAIVTTSKAS